MKTAAARNSTVLTAAVLAYAIAGPAGAYCVHNKADLEFYVTQTSNGSFWKPFSAKLQPGENACCSWTEKDCNKSGGQTDRVGFTASTGGHVIYYPGGGYACQDYQIPANGDLYVKGSGGHYSCSQSP